MRRAMSARAHGVLVLVGPFLSSGQRQAIVDIAAELRLPAMYETREYVFNRAVW